MSSKENMDPIKGESEVEGQKDKKFLIRRKILIPMTNGTNPTNEEEDEDAVKPKAGKKMWKTFKRQSTTEEENKVVGETAEDKKKKFRERQGSVEATVESDSGNAPAKARRKKLGELGKSISVEDLIDLSEEEREKRSWKEQADAKVANKKNKMLMKTKKQWKSYEKEPGQLNYDKYYKMKEEHKEKMKNRRLSQESIDPDKMSEFENKSFDDDGEGRKEGNAEQNGLDINEDGIRKERSMSDSSEDSNESNTDANYLDTGKRFSVDFSGSLSIEEHPLEDHAAQKNLATLPPAGEAKDEPLKKVNDEVENEVSKGLEKNNIAGEQSMNKETTHLQSSEKVDGLNNVEVKGSENKTVSKDVNGKGSEKEKASTEGKKKSSEKEKELKEEKEKSSLKEKGSKEEDKKDNDIKTTSKEEDKQIKDENSINLPDQSKPAIEIPTEKPYNAPKRMSLRERLQKKESQEKENGETIKQDPIIIKPKKLVTNTKEPIPKKENIASKEQDTISSKTEKDVKNGEANVKNEEQSKLEESKNILDGKTQAVEGGKEKEKKSSPIDEDIVEAINERRVETEVPLVETNAEKEIKDKQSNEELGVKKESKHDASKEPESKKATPSIAQNSGGSTAKGTQEDITIQKEKLAKEKDIQIENAKKDKAKGNAVDTLKSKKEIKKEPALTGKPQIGEAMGNKKQQNNKSSEDKQKSQSTKETEKNKLKGKQAAPQPVKKGKVIVTNDKLTNGSDMKRGRAWGKPPPPANPINCFTNTNYDVKKKFLHTIDIDPPEINETTLTMYRKYHYEQEEGCTIEQDVEEENEEIQVSMDEMHKMNGVVSRTNEVWHIFAGGKQTIDREQASRRFVPINRISDFELKSDKSNPANNEKWLLVVRGGDKNLPSKDEFVEDLDDTNWFSIIQGTAVNVDKPKFLKKTLCWEAEKQLGASDRLRWDADNIPIPSNELVHFGHHKGMFQKVEREKYSSLKLIKARKLNHDAYCISNVAKEIQNASDYFQPIMRKVHIIV